MENNGNDDDDDRVLDALTIDLEVAHIGEILERHGVSPTAELVNELWEFLESKRGGGDGNDGETPHAER